MKSKVLAVLIPALLTLVPGQTRAGKDESIARLKEHLVNLETQSWEAWKKRDGRFFAGFLSEDHVEVGFFGPVGKAAVVQGVGSPSCVVERYTIGDFRLTLLEDDVAALTYRADQSTTCNEWRVPSPAWVTSLYLKRHGRWENALYQQTPDLRK
jgi:Domain of unknown function (DUF4440)